MATRLALVNCKESAEGPWTIAKGNEWALEIFDLGEGAYIRLDFVANGDPVAVDYYKSGVHLLPRISFERYRVCKVGSNDLATIVRVQLNGKS